MALTAQQKADIRRYLGWSARFHQYDSRLEQAMSAIDTEPEHESQLTETLANHGILANIADVLTKLRDAHGRLKASKVGSIDLNDSELRQLRKEGDRWVADLSSVLGVEVRNGGIFGTRLPRAFSGFGGQYGGGNFVGK